MKMRTKFLSVLLSCTFVVSGPAAATSLALEDPELIEYVQVNTEVPGTGQVVNSISITVSDAAVLEGLTVNDFTVTGTTGTYREDPADFTAEVTGLDIQDSILTLELKDFGTYYKMMDFSVICTNDQLSFDMSDVDYVAADEANKFDLYTIEEGAPFNYALYSPTENEEPLPLVLTIHGGGEKGYGEFMNLYANRVVLSWASDEQQEKHPSYVLAPQFFPDNDQIMTHEELIEKSVALIQQMIDEGKVDPNRVYITGCSFYGTTYRYLLDYPDFFAAAIPMCASLKNYIEPENGGTYTLEEMADIIKDIPIWLVHAADDTGVPAQYSRDMYQALLDAGSTTVKYTEYTKEQMDARGLKDMYHNCWVLANEDPAFFDWMFEQVKNTDENVTGDTSSENSTSNSEDISKDNPGTGSFAGTENGSAWVVLVLGVAGLSTIVLVSKARKADRK